MKALLKKSAGPGAAFEGVDDLRIKPDELLIKVHRASICGSDLPIYNWYSWAPERFKTPSTFGHEFCGTVAEVGAAVEGFRPGDRVAVEPMVFCGACEPCREGHPNLCANRRFFGVMACNGSMAEYLNVPARLLFRMPEGMTPEIGAMVEPAAVALHAVRRAGRIEGAAVLVVGAGPIGLLLVGMVKAQRPRLLLVSDLSDQRLLLARSMGADVAVNPSREKVVDTVGRHTGGRGADVSFEAVGAGPSVEQALAALRPRGSCVWVGNSQRMISLDMQASVTREIAILGSYIYTPAEFGEALELLGRNAIDVRPIISRTVALERGPEMFAALSDPSVGLIKVVLESRPEPA